MINDGGDTDGCHMHDLVLAVIYVQGAAYSGEQRRTDFMVSYMHYVPAINIVACHRTSLGLSLCARSEIL